MNPKTLAIHAGARPPPSRAIPLSPPLCVAAVSALGSHPHHEVARRVLDVEAAGFGGVLAFELRGATRKEAFSFLERVKLARAAPSLGDVATLVMHPATASARKLTPEERAAAGVTEDIIRVSVGLEDPAEVAEDILQAAAGALGRT